MNREEVIEIAKAGGMKASFGKTTDGKYAPNVNALGSSIPVEWLEAAFNEVERRTIEKCAQVCDEMLVHYTDYKDTALLNGDIDLSNAASGEPRACEFLAEAIRALANQQEKQQ